MNQKFVASGKGAESLRNFRGILKKIICNDPFPDPISCLFSLSVFSVPHLGHFGYEFLLSREEAEHDLSHLRGKTLGTSADEGTPEKKTG